jgi:hypothetical protein
MAAIAQFTALRPAAASQAQDASAPPKYIEKSGIRHLNPDYSEYMKHNNKSASTALAPSEARPIVCNMNEFREFQKLAPATLAPSTETAMKMLQERATTDQVGLSADALEDQIGALCSKYDIPMGLMEKLMHFKNFDLMEFTVDDSSSMRLTSDGISRWDEAKERLKTMIEILAYVPTPKIVINFLNREETIVLNHSGESPDLFIANANEQIERIFKQQPYGSTPIVATLQKSFIKSNGMKVARYLFCDGEPDGRDNARKEIKKMLNNRPNQMQNPMTFLSCTNVDTEAAWMKETEEEVDYCAECDDFETEAKEVREDQGTVLPYTYGFYLACQLAAAMNPDDLDALDESVPLTKKKFDNLMGVIGLDKEYELYFFGFIDAQELRKSNTPVDLVKKQQQWGSLYNDFLHAENANDIPAVQAYKARLEAAGNE